MSAAKAPLGSSGPGEAGARGSAGHRRWTLPLFGAAVAVFWAGLWLSGTLFPARADKRVYGWPADAVAVRQVVIEVPSSGADLRWAATEAPRMETNEPPYAEPRLTLVREGDTLYVRRNPAAQASSRRYQRHNLRLTLPRTVVRVSGNDLSMHDGEAPAQLELAGRNVRVRTQSIDGTVDHLRVLALGTRCDGTSDQVSSEVLVEASGLKRLEVETLGGKVQLQHLRGVTAMSLRGPDDLALSIDRVGQLARLDFGALPPERQAAMRQQAEAMQALQSDSACTSSGSRMMSAK